jgi:lysophospholipase L1-like esterase
MRSEPGDRREKVRILCLGDSCTYGLGLPIDQAWPAALDRLLESAEVVNAGVPGYSSYQGRILFEDRCEDLDPDVLVVTFGQNDVAAWPTRQDGRVVQLHDRDRAGHIGYARTPSRFLQWLLSGRLRRPELLPAGMSPEYWLPRVSVSEFRANLEHFAGLAPTVVFVAWVRRKELDPPYRDVHPLERQRRYDEVILSMRSAGHAVLSVEALFRKSGLPLDRLFADNVHATKEGAQLVARELADHLRDRK